MSTTTSKEETTKETSKSQKVIFNLKGNSNNKSTKNGGKTIMKFKFMGVGAAGNKAAMALINAKVASDKDVILVNSTDKDIPKDFGGKVVIISNESSGCAKERKYGKQFAIECVKNGDFDKVLSDDDTHVVIISSVEGGTGSGAAPVIGKYIATKDHPLTVSMIAFLGFEDDSRGFENTLGFLNDINFECSIQLIRNISFLESANGNKFKAEKLANEELVERVKTMLGMYNAMETEQNIDDMEMEKLVGASGYTTIESIYFDSNIMDAAEFNKLCKQMVYQTKSLKSSNPCQIYQGVILNIKPESEDGIDYSFASLKEMYGNAHDKFLHKQYDGGRQYMKFISAGMKMPLDEVKIIYERYKEESASVDKSSDNFFEEIGKFDIEDTERFNISRRRS